MDALLNHSLLHLLHRASQVADDIFAGHAELNGLTSRQFIVLAAISAREGASQTDITEVTGVDRSTLTDLIGRLQSRGLVARKRSQNDARSYEVRLTLKGRNLLVAAVPIARNVDERLLASLPAKARKEFVEQLQGMVAATGGPVPGAKSMAN